MSEEYLVFPPTYKGPTKEQVNEWFASLSSVNAPPNILKHPAKRILELFDEVIVFTPGFSLASTAIVAENQREELKRILYSFFRLNGIAR